MNASQTVYIVDDDPDICRSLSTLVRSIRLPVETYESAQRFLAAVTPEHSGCVIIDLRLPDMSGRELQARLKEVRARLPVLFLSAFGDIETAVAAMKDGAVDFLVKPCSGPRLLDRVKAAMQRCEAGREQIQRFANVRERLELLSPGERDVLDGIVAGKPYKTIAKELGLSYKTVEARRGRIVRKLDVESMPELVRMVLEFQLNELASRTEAEPDADAENHV